MEINKKPPGAAMSRRAKLQIGAAALCLVVCIAAGYMETHLVLGAWITLGLICTAGVLLRLSDYGGGEEN